MGLKEDLEENLRLLEEHQKKNQIRIEATKEQIEFINTHSKEVIDLFESLEKILNTTLFRYKLEEILVELKKFEQSLKFGCKIERIANESENDPQRKTSS